jgi:hypothetical protein
MVRSCVWMRKGGRNFNCSGTAGDIRRPCSTLSIFSVRNSKNLHSIYYFGRILDVGSLLLSREFMKARPSVPGTAHRRAF